MERPAVAINDMSDRYYISHCNSSYNLARFWFYSNVNFFLPKMFCYFFSTKQELQILITLTLLKVRDAAYKKVQLSFSCFGKEKQCFAFCQRPWHLYNPMTKDCLITFHIAASHRTLPIWFGNTMELMTVRNNLLEAIQTRPNF